MSDRESKSRAISMFEKSDEEQIAKADSKIKEAMVYEMQGEKQLTYIGLKHLTLLMSQKDNPLEVMDTEVKLEKVDPDNQATWIWYATYKVRNQKTRHESIGMSEASYFDQGKYDKFGRTKAMSKAERNAWRKQIPELEIRALIETASENGKVHTFENKPSSKPETPSTTSTNTDGFCHCMDENTQPNYTTGKCEQCNYKMSEYKVTRMKAKSG